MKLLMLTEFVVKGGLVIQHGHSIFIALILRRQIMVVIQQFIIQNDDVADDS